MPDDQITIADSPTLPGLSFRHFRGESDYPSMVRVILSSAEADKIETTITVEEMADRYHRLTNCDPFQDMILAEIGGEVIGYGRCWWWDDLPAGQSPVLSTGRIYESVAFLVPEWRRRGIGRAMLLWLEDHLRQVAATHPQGQARFFQASAGHYQGGAAILLERSGYAPMRYWVNMVRPTLEDIADFPLPAGLEIRSVLPDHYRAIWASNDETGQDEWGYTPHTEEDYQAWLTSPRFQPHLWQVAWDIKTGRVAGQVLTYIDQDENEKYGRKRGYTEGIGVDRAWRRRGLARALIARSLQAQKDAGMTESALVADSDSISNVTQLYKSCGFQVVRRDAVYRKPF